MEGNNVIRTVYPGVSILSRSIVGYYSFILTKPPFASIAVSGEYLSIFV